MSDLILGSGEIHVQCIWIEFKDGRKRLVVRLPPLGSRVCISVTPCGFSWWTKLSLCRFFWVSTVPAFLHTHLNYFLSFYFISPCDSTTKVVRRRPCYSRTFNIKASSHLIPRIDPVPDTIEKIYYVTVTMHLNLDKSTVLTSICRMDDIKVNLLHHGHVSRCVHCGTAASRTTPELILLLLGWVLGGWMVISTVRIK